MFVWIYCKYYNKPFYKSINFSKFQRVSPLVAQRMSQWLFHLLSNVIQHVLLQLFTTQQLEEFQLCIIFQLHGSLM